MSAREEVLQRIRSATAPAPAVLRAYRVADDAPASLDLLVDRLIDYRAGVHRVTAADVPALLDQLTHGERLVVPSDLEIDGWRGSSAVRDRGFSAQELDGFDAVITTCALAIAETGTVVLDGGAGQGRRAVTLVPDHHVLIVRTHQVVATVPQAVAQLNARRPQTWISGPSATSDIELQRVEGVHGPRRLDVILVNAG